MLYVRGMMQIRQVPTADCKYGFCIDSHLFFANPVLAEDLKGVYAPCMVAQLDTQ